MSIPPWPDLKKEELEKRLATLVEQYKAANTQLRTTTDAVNKPVIEGQIEQLEADIQQIQSELNQIPVQPAKLDDTQEQQGNLREIENKLNTLETLFRQLLLTGLEPASTPVDAYGISHEADGLSSMTERDWRLLLRNIKKGNCTPFLGFGMYSNIYPQKSEIAQKWAKDYEYPLADAHNIVRVAQFLDVEFESSIFSKEKWLDEFAQVGPPDFTDPNEPHRILADLPLPVYITTNYDDFMVQALKERQNKDPKQELCRWNDLLKNQPSIFETDLSFKPTPANPVVFHLHGCHRRGDDELPESLVLTEDDYFDFLINVSKDQDLIPPRIQRVLTRNPLLFLGYQITDWDFRVLLRILTNNYGKSLSGVHVSVQLVPDEGKMPQERIEKIQKYLNRYFGSQKPKIRVYWGTCHEFAVELRKRWEVFNRGQ